MKKAVQVFTLAVFLLSLSIDTNAQGCSDAGFCTIGSLSQQQKNSTSKQKISIFLPVGIGDDNVTIFTPAIQYDNQLGKSLGIQAKLTGNYASGVLGSVAGAGDLFLSATYLFPSKKKTWDIAASLGTKLPLNSSNLKSGGNSLPMPYQSSLGTVDLIVGFSASNTKWQFAAGLQQPLSGANGNNFLPILWSNPAAGNYAPTNKFYRKADVLVRGFYKHSFNSKLKLHGGLLGIYHVADDEYTNIFKNKTTLQGSKGLTLNASVVGWYAVNKKMSIGLTVAAPLLVRDTRPDGLTRSFVVSPEISWSF